MLWSMRSVLALSLIVAACSPSPAGGPAGNQAAPALAPGTLVASSQPPQTAVTGEITVFAAASLTDAFQEMGERFKTAHPSSSVTFNFGASTQLVTQLDQGAQADVFASADQVQMDRAKAANRVAGPDAVFATNRLVITTPASNPGRIAGHADLARPGLRIVTTQSDVPIGAYTQAMLEKMSGSRRLGADFKDKVNANVVSREANVRQIVAKVQLGEADAGVVYKSDVTPQAAGQLATIDIPDEFNAPASYPIAEVSGAPNRAGAAAFVTFVLSPEGQGILAKWNFVPIRGDG
jgi:molybdate transport system substrate-binding protein